MTTVRRIVTFFALPLLPLCSLLGQQTPAKPQNAAPRSSGSEMVLNFGPTVSNPEGKAAAGRLLQALGGPAKVNEVKSLRQTVVALRQGQRMELEQSIVYPKQQAQRMRLPQGKALLVVTPADAFTVVGGQVQDLPPAQRSAMDATLQHDFINVLQRINDPKYIFVATGQEKVGDVQATVVDVEADGVPTRWWIATDGKLLQERYSDMGAGAGGIQTMIYSDWKNFGGLMYPTKYALFNEGGEPQMTMTLTAMEVNAPVSPKLFERPAQ
ncbi:MAG: hypothetical protein ACLPPV_19065 [Candidatus Korobacteraceae bacterium]|jgi:hypothetical protein